MPRHHPDLPGLPPPLPHPLSSGLASVQPGQNRPIIAAAHAIDTFLGNVPVGSGLIATSERYGATSTLLMGLHSPQHVRTFAANATLRPTDVPEGVHWIVTPRSMAVDIAGKIGRAACRERGCQYV